MLQLQDQINSQVNPDWKSAKQDWLTAIFVESGECAESYGYKWWKKQTPDMDNVRLELVDIWHFIMSHYIEKLPDIDVLASSIHEIFSINGNTGYTFNETIRFMNVHMESEDYEQAWDSFAYLCNLAELSWEQLYSTYIAKNALNAFRANNGYKEGTYNKIWYIDNIYGDREDNYFLMEYIKTLDIAKTENLYDEVYNYLTAAYQTV